jgi:twitching motility protein PilT
VILVGEMRDLETISTAITAAETGHLVLSTLHTPDAPQTIDRLIDIFPPHQQKQIMIQLAGSLQGVICQQLLPRKNITGRVVACEIMTATPAVRSLIREQKTEQLSTVIQTNAKNGMVTMDKTLKKLYEEGIIDEQTVKFKAKDRGEFDNL